MKVIKESDARSFFDGPELCRDYIRIDRLWFGTSTLRPGETGGIDYGHPVSKEVFYAASGIVSVRNPATGECFTLRTGDALLIDEGEPHELTNIGGDMAVVVWSGAPNG